MKTYYHVSRDVENDISVFVPRSKPTFSGMLAGEDTTINRVSLCENISDCLNALNYPMNDGVWDEDNEQFHLFKIYVFHLNENDIMPYTEVAKYVPDAQRTKECWSLEPITPAKTILARPTFFHIEDNYPYTIHDVEFEDIEELEAEMLELNNKGG